MQLWQLPWFFAKVNILLRNGQKSIGGDVFWKGFPEIKVKLFSGIPFHDDFHTELTDHLEIKVKPVAHYMQIMAISFTEI